MSECETQGTVDKNRGALSATTCKENIRRLLRPKGGNAAQRATDWCRLSALRWTTRKGRECPGKRVLFLSCLAVRAKRHTGSKGSRPLGPNCRYSETALFVSYKSGGRCTDLLRYRSSPSPLSHWLSSTPGIYLPNASPVAAGTHRQSCGVIGPLFPVTT